jgi:hypothetical protein
MKLIAAGLETSAEVSQTRHRDGAPSLGARKPSARQQHCLYLLGQKQDE